MYLEKSDSVIKTLKKHHPLYKVEISDNTGKTVMFETYQIEKLQHSGNRTGIYDLNYCYLFINKKEVAIAKFVEIDLITRDIDFFLK